jgi:general secretion pathway protein D
MQIMFKNKLTDSTIKNPKASMKFMLLMVFALQLLLGCAMDFGSQKKKDAAPKPEDKVEKAKNALSGKADSVENRQNLHISKELATYELLTLAEQAMLKKDFSAAKAFYERVLSFAPKNQSAIAGIKEVERELKTHEQVESASKALSENRTEEAKETVQQALLTNPNSEDARNLSDNIHAKQAAEKNKQPKLKINHTKPISLELKDVPAKTGFEALSRSTGVNFVLDKEIKPENKISISVRNMSIEDTIDMVVASNGFQKKVLSENTLFIFQNTPQKKKEYQDLKIRSFYLNNASAKEVANMFKTILKTKDIYMEERLNLVVIRDTPDAVSIAEKLVNVVDVADSEVMLNIEVLEVSRNRLQELGIVYPNQLSVISESTGLTLEALKKLNSSSIGVSPNPAINFKKTVGDVNLLSNPRIRVKNNEKAKILVGDKVPIITTTSTANVGVSENVTYVDVGLKLEVEPKINLENFVSIKVGLEVSSLGDKTVTNNGATVYTIGTRNAATLLRLKDGETQILAGLIQDEDRKNAARVPGLGDIPILGRLFSNQEDKKTKTEIVLAITPRVLSNLQLPKSNVFDFWSGTENELSDTLKKFNAPASSSGAARDDGVILPSQDVSSTPEERLKAQIIERAQEIETKKAEAAANEQANPGFPKVPEAKPASTVTFPSQ